MRLLVTEDDPALGAFLKKGLAIEGYQVDLAVTGQSCLHRLRSQPYHLVLLDLSLPDMDGTELLPEIEELATRTPAIVLTGRHQVEERIRCLDLGADDFLVKPFSFGELTARCRAALRRNERAAATVVRVGDLTLHRVDRRFSLGDSLLELTPKEFALLEALTLRAEACCTREELLTMVWNAPAESATNVVDVYINYVRRKLSGALPVRQLAATPRIQTVRGSGYRLTAAAVNQVPRSEADGTSAARRWKA